MADGSFHIKAEDTVLSTRHSAASATFCDLPAVKVKVENEEEAGGTNDTEIGLKEIKLEKADGAPEDVMTSSGHCKDISMLKKEKDAGVCFDLVKKIKMEKRLISEEGDGTNNTGNGMREMKVEKADALTEEDETSSAGRIQLRNSCSQFVDTSVLTKEEDLGIYFEEEKESAQVGRDICASSGYEAGSSFGDRVSSKEEMNQKFDEFSGIQGSSREPAVLFIVYPEPIISDRDKSDSLQGDPLVGISGKSFVCTKCMARFRTKADLKRHAVTHSNERPFSCPDCPSKFKDKSYLREHAIIHSNDRPFSCPHCTSKFKDRRNLKGHLLVHSNEKPYSCAHCAASFKSKSYLRVHAIVHSNDKPFLCTHCPATFASKRQMNKHLTVHSKEKPFECAQCLAIFKTKQNLREHVVIHLNNRPFACSICAAVFKRKKYLNKHAIVHSNERPFKCVHCPATFTQNSYLKQHSLLHSIGKPYLCTQCPARFTWKRSLRYHVAIHSNEKSYSCPHCSSKFKIRSYLTKHLIRHSSSFSCSHCPSSFKDRRTLKIHLLIHSEEKQLPSVH